MIIDKAVDVLSKREGISVFGLPGTVTNKLGDIAISAGAWVNHTCYAEQCRRLQERSSITVESQEGIVTGLGQIVICAVQGKARVDLRNLRRVIDDVSHLLEDADYGQVFDGSTTEVLEKFAPLHDES